MRRCLLVPLKGWLLLLVTLASCGSGIRLDESDEDGTEAAAAHDLVWWSSLPHFGKLPLIHGCNRSLQEKAKHSKAAERQRHVQSMRKHPAHPNRKAHIWQFWVMLGTSLLLLAPLRSR
eukprot:TRINITY_DN80373_c0_g1_i1.p3 TRINITY_DN80373_c0_g1~~TRINITY_DN80373_c0_g1_i1.p3  ORF type:complete len:119 (-),score=32.98 TRINITY_DN80373_c0_g1_i1:61-417(-)